MNFTWTFSGDVGSVEWGLQEDDFMWLGTRLVTINRLGSVLITSSAAYRGRVSGSGGPLSGQAVFTLTSITRNDEGFYGCKINAFNDPFDVPNYDSVPLAVQGTYLLKKKTKQNKDNF